MAREACVDVRDDGGGSARTAMVLTARLALLKGVRIFGNVGGAAALSPPLLPLDPRLCTCGAIAGSPPTCTRANNM